MVNPRKPSDQYTLLKGLLSVAAVTTERSPVEPRLDSALILLAMWPDHCAVFWPEIIEIFHQTFSEGVFPHRRPSSRSRLRCQNFLRSYSLWVRDSESQSSLRSLLKRFGSPIPPERQIDLGLLDEYARDPKVATTVRLLAIYVVYWSSNNHQNFMDHVHQLVEQSAISIGAADAIIAPRTVANTLNMLAEWLGDDSFIHRESNPAQTGFSATEDTSEMAPNTSQTNLCVAPNPCAGEAARVQRSVVTHGAFALGGISLGVLLTLLAVLSPLRDKFSPQRMPPAPQSSTR